MGTEMVPETLVCFDHLTLLMAREGFVEFDLRGSFKYYK
jgi:hypothetical protein